MMQPGSTSGRVKVLARTDTPPDFSIVDWRTWPSNFTSVPSGLMVRPVMYTTFWNDGENSMLMWPCSVPFCVKILMRMYSSSVSPDEGAFDASSISSRYRIMASAPGCLGLSFIARSSGGIGSHPSVAREVRAPANRRRHTTAIRSERRWVGFIRVPLAFLFYSRAHHARVISRAVKCPQSYREIRSSVNDLRGALNGTVNGLGSPPPRQPGARVVPRAAWAHRIPLSR